ncbi:MAG: hypothetical protein JW709_00900 [Sedimentisphaerales bacterium]|nr:hypothetical protein [Sedimentisphaerales bacterium]
MKLVLEVLEARVMLAAPIAPFDLDLPAASDSGDSDSDDITNIDDGTMELVAETDSTVNVYNFGGLLGTATEQNDVLFYETGGTVIIEAELGTLSDTMVTGGGTYITTPTSTVGNPRGIATYQVYISTPGTYYFRAWVRLPTGGQDSFFVNVDDIWEAGDDGPGCWGSTGVVYDVRTATTEINVAGNKSWVLGAGWVTVEVHGREPDFRLDRFALSIFGDVDVNPATGAPANTTYETFSYAFQAGDMIGSSSGTANSLTATATNIDGTSAASTALALTLDNAAPAKPTLPDLAASDDSGSSSSDNITNVPDPTISGYAEPNSTVTIDLNAGDHTGETTAGADGSWTYAITSGWLDANNTLTVTATDIAGNVSVASNPLTITYDVFAADPVVAPDLSAASDTGSLDTDNITNDATPTLTGAPGSVDAGATVTVRVGGVNKRTTTAAGDGSWTITLQAGDLAEGANTVDYIYTDAAGNTSGDSPNLTVTLDTVSDAPDVTDLTALTDTGGSNSDNITYNHLCEITGTGPRDGTIHIFVNGTEVDTTTTNGAGNWSHTFTNGQLVEGLNTITATAEDEHGNPEGAPGAALNITLDRIIATPAPPDLQAGSDNGSSSIDNITSIASPVFDGYAEPGSTVQLYVGAAGKGTDVADASTGAWSIPLDPGDLASGANSITVKATDVAGNTATSNALVVTYYSTAGEPNGPRLLAASDSGTSAADRITNVQAPTVYGSVADGNPVDAYVTVHVRCNPNGGGWDEVGSTIADGQGNWSFTLAPGDIEEGSNLVDIFITDLSNNNSTDSADLTIILDLTAAAPAAPDLTAGTDSGSSNSDNITNNTSPAFTGAVEANSKVYLRIDGADAKNEFADVGGAYAITLDGNEMIPGTHQVDVYYVDPAGNISTVSSALTVTLDTSAAAPAVVADLDAASDTGSSAIDNLTKDTTPTLSAPAGSVEANSLVTIRADTANVGTTTANADGSWSLTLAGGLSENVNLIDYYYTDLAGNVSGVSGDLTVTLDTTPPAVVAPDLDSASDTGDSDTDNITSETRPTIFGAPGSLEANNIVAIWLDTPTTADTEVGATTVAGNGSWSYTFTMASPLEEGVNLIHIVATDTAGNVSAASDDLTVTIDFETGAEGAPDLDAASDTGSSTTDNITKESMPTINGLCPAGAQIKIRTNETTIVSFTDNGVSDNNPAAGQWSYTFLAALNPGANTIDFLTIDTLNNTSDWSQDLVVTVDTSIAQPSAPNLADVSDSGANSADDITNDTTPTLNGSAEAGSTVTIDVNGGSHTTTTIAGVNGSWSCTLPINWITEGNNTIFVTAVDVAGNTSVASGNLAITLDTTINAPSTPDLTAATDTGASSTDNITSHANPRIVGTADASTTITVRLDPDGANTTIGTTFANAAGNWSYTFASTDLSEGDNIIDVLSTDTAGNAIDSGELTITLETAINTPDNLDLTAASDLGEADDDNLTSLTTATITGDADASCTVYVRVNGTVVGSTTANGGGNWTYTFDGVDDLIEGSNIIDAYAEDGSGNVSGFSADLIVVLDITAAAPLAPDLTAASDTGSVDTDNITNDATATITGYCEAGATVWIHLNGADAFDSVIDGDSDGVWTYTFALGDLNASDVGTANTIKAAQTDRAGQTSVYGATLTITLDNAAQTPTAPDLLAESDTGDADDDDLINQFTATVSGSVEAGSSVQLYIDSGLVDTISEHLIATGNWSYTFTSGQLSEGVNLITVIAVDKADNVSAESPALAITLDRTVNTPGLPDLVASSDTGDSDNDEVTSDDTPTFTGTCDPNCHVTIRVNGEPINTVDADGAGIWTYTFALGEISTGVRQIDVIATDPAGNVSNPSSDLTIWLNVQPTQPARPNLMEASDTGISATDNITYATTPTIDGKADAIRTIHVYVDGGEVGTTMSDANGFYQFTFADGDLVEGDNAITIITEDSSGLLSAESYVLTVTLDTTPPASPAPDLQSGSDTGASDTDNLTSDRTATIDQTTEANALVDIYLEGVWQHQTTTSVTGYWSYTFAPDDLQEGVNLITITITDVAGNLSAVSTPLAITLDLDQTPPNTPDLDADSDTGNSDTDNLTNNPASTIRGTVNAHDIVQILVSGVNVGTLSADEAGAWQYSFTNGQLVSGLNVIEVISTNSVGTTARSEPLNLILDTITPTIFNYAPSGVYTHTTNTIELFIAGDDLDEVAAGDTTGYTLYGSGGDGGFDDGNEWLIPITNISVDTVSGLVQLTTAVVLTDDCYRLIIDPTLSLRDLAGNSARLNVLASGAMANSGQEIEIDFEIDTAGPPAPQTPILDADSDTGASAGDAITNENRPLIRVFADPDVSLEIICNGRSAGFANEVLPGQYELIINPSLIREGENLLLARAFDGLGNSSDLSDLAQFTYDSAPPVAAGVIAEDLYLNTGPIELNVVFTDNDLDPTSIGSFDNYRLLAAGGDGGFSDGNETYISLVGVTYNAQTQSVILSLPRTSTGVSQLTPDRYQLTILANGDITDLAGNVIDQATTCEFNVVPAPVIHANQSYTFTTLAGARISIRLIGAGDAQILLGESIGSSNIIDQLSLSNTTSSTMLLITSSDLTSNFTLGRLLIDSPLSTILANSVLITECFTAEDNVGRVTLAGLAADAVADLTTNGGVNLTFSTIAAGASLSVHGQLAALRVNSVVDAAITADAIGSIIVIREGFDADLTTTVGGLESLMVFSGDVSGSFTIAGNLGRVLAFRGQFAADVSAANIDSVSAAGITDSIIRATQAINSIRVGTADNAVISAGQSFSRFLATGAVNETTLAAGGNLGSVMMLNDCVDSMLLAGVDLGADVALGGLDDAYSAGSLDLLMVQGQFTGTIAAAAIDPGADYTYFTADDAAVADGVIRRLLLGTASLNTTTASRSFGFIASTPLPTMRLNGNAITAPFDLDQFHLRILSVE